MAEETKLQTTASEENIVGDLLVKDNSGKLHYFDQDKNDVVFDTSLVKSASPVAQDAVLPVDDHFVADQNQNNDQSKAGFSFHPDDQKDIDDLAQNLPQDDSKKYSLEKIVDKLISEHQLKLELEMREKFTSMVFDFFRNRKNAIVLRELMSENILEGEKVLSEETVNSLVSILKTVKKDIDQAGGLVVRAADIKPVNKTEKVLQVDSPELEQDLSQAVADLQAEIPVTPVMELEKELNSEDLSEDENVIGNEVTQSEIQNILADLNHNVKKQAGTEEEDKEEAEEKVENLDTKEVVEAEEKNALPVVAVSNEAMVQDVPVVAKPEINQTEKVEEVSAEQESDKETEAEIETSLPKVSRPKQAPAKNQISDVMTKTPSTSESSEQMISQSNYPDTPPVKTKANLTGPIEELQGLTLDNFRRLGNSPSEQISKLLAKINLLEKDSVTKKAQGIEAWRNSPVYSQYLSLGEESLGQGKEMTVVIQGHQAQNQEVLSMEEFSAISDLNKHLRF